MNSRKTHEQISLRAKGSSGSRSNTLYRFPVVAAVLLHLFTLGFFTNIFYLAKHNRLPVLQTGDIKGHRAWAFLFIPFFNMYWIFHAWGQLIDRLNFQLKLKGEHSRIPKTFVIVTIAISIIPYVGLISGLFMWPFCVGFVQQAINRIAE